MQIKRVIAAGSALLLCLAHGAAAHVPRGRPARSDHHAFSRGGRFAQAIQSIEFNGINVLHEDLLHSMSPVQEKLDVTRHGIQVSLRFQFDDMMAQSHPMARPQSHGSLSIVHNETRVELVRMPLRYDSNARSELRGELQFGPETRRKLKKECANASCMAHVSVNNRLMGRPTVIELGKLKFFKKSNGKTGVKLLTYPRLVESTASDSSWDGYGLAASAAFHFLLILGAGLMILVGSEAYRALGLLPKGDPESVKSQRWLRLALALSVLYMGLSGSRAMGWVATGELIYVAPTLAIVSTVALCMAGGPVEEVVEEQAEDDDYMGEDEDDDAVAEVEDTDLKKTN